MRLTRPHVLYDRRTDPAIAALPADRVPLRLAEPGWCDRLNRAIREGKIYNRLGRRITQTLDGGLLNEEAGVLYPIRRGIPQLVVDEMIPLEQLDTGEGDSNERQDDFSADHRSRDPRRHRV